MSREPEKLAVLMAGLGAVATTTIAGIEMVRQKQRLPIGSLTQLGTARIGSRKHMRSVPIRELVPLASLDQLVFGAWDIIDENGAEVAARTQVLSREDLALAHEFLTQI